MGSYSLQEVEAHGAEPGHEQRREQGWEQGREHGERVGPLVAARGEASRHRQAGPHPLGSLVPPVPARRISL